MTVVAAPAAFLRSNFASTVVPEKWALVYALNPMVGVIDGFRWSLLGEGQPLRLASVGISLAITLLLLIPGLAFFRRSEHHFADAL